MELNQDELEMLHFFCFRLLRDLKNGRYNMPNIKFVFTEKDNEKILAHLESLKRDGHAIYMGLKTHISERNVMVTEIEDTISLIKNTQYDYKNTCNQNAIYIEIPDYKEFFKLLNELMIAFEEKSDINNFTFQALLHSMWLRMNPSDTANVLAFLERQITFTKNDTLISSNNTEFKKIGHIYISYFNQGNKDWFETNRNIRILLKRKVGEMEGFYPGTKINLYNNYYLPVIHFGLAKENDEKTCYIYGIQQLDHNDQDIVVKNIIQEERKRLRNKYVSPDFIIALKIFIDILKEKGITSIKVPLLQVYNYEYHQNMGNKFYEKLSSYSPEKIHDLEWMNAPDYAIEEYENIKKQVERFYEKEDMISANKTERLIYAFYIMAEKYDNIDILTDPFIESDTLICKIKEEKKNIQL